MKLYTITLKAAHLHPPNLISVRLGEKRKEREESRGGGWVKEEREREQRRCNYQERSLRDQLHFKEAGPRVPCSTQPRVPVL